VTKEHDGEQGRLFLTRRITEREERLKEDIAEMYTLEKIAVNKTY
jgi:hypothetical protein